MAIRILRSATTATPPALLEGQPAYSEDSGNLFIGTSGNGVTKIGGATDVAKLATVAPNAQVNTVDSVNGATGVVDLALGDLVNMAVDFTSQMGANVLASLSNVDETGASNGQFLQYNGGNYTVAAVPGGVSTFDGLNDTPPAKVINNYLKVNGAGDSLVYTPDIDDGTF